MDFERVLTLLLKGFEEQRIRYGVIGGFALGLLGSPRATMDLDFLVHRDDLEKLHQLFMRLGYQRDVWRENVSQYSHPIRPLGSIDVLHAFRPYALEMLTRARTIACLDIGSVHVLEPEDIIGLKVQAIANNPERRSHETADIETLMFQYGSQFDWDRIQTYYDLFELRQEAQALRARYGQAHQS